MPLKLPQVFPIMADQDFSIATYQRHLGQHRLMASRCRDCGQMHLPPRPICPACHGRGMEWRQLQGEGTVIGATAIAVVPTAMAARGFGRNNPYVSAVIELKEGPTITARVQTADTSEGLPVEVGTRMRADFVEETVGDAKRVTLVFRPDGSG